MAEDMDRHDMAEDLLHEKYQDMQVIQENLEHIGQVLSNFIAQLPQGEAWQWGQKLGVPWGAVRSLDEIVGDEHLQARGFFTEVEHPELGRSFTYPGPAAIYNASPWRIARRAPLIGEHNPEILCDELWLSRGELVALREAGVV